MSNFWGAVHFDTASSRGKLEVVEGEPVEDVAVEGIAHGGAGEDEVVEAAVDFQAGDVGAEHAAVAADVGWVEHGVAGVVDGCPVLAAAHGTRGVHQQDGHTDASFAVAKAALSAVDGADPSGGDVGGVERLPVGVEGPLAVGAAEEALAVAGAVALADAGVGEEFTPEGHQGHDMLLPAEIPVEEGAIEQQGLDVGAVVAGHEAGGDEASGGVAHEGDAVDAGALYGH